MQIFPKITCIWKPELKKKCDWHVWTTGVFGVFTGLFGVNTELFAWMQCHSSSYRPILFCSVNTYSTLTNRRIRALISGQVLLWQIPLNSLHPRNPPNPESQILGCTIKFFQNFDLNLYRKILENLSFLIWWISGIEQVMSILSGKCHAVVFRDWAN